MTPVSTGGRLCFPSRRLAVPRQRPGPRVRRVPDARTQAVVRARPERGGRVFALGPGVPAVEDDRDYRAMYGPDHLCKCTGRLTPQPAMRAVFLILSISAVLAAGRSTPVQAQATSHPGKSTAKASSATQTHHPTAVGKAASSHTVTHSTPAKATAAADEMTPANSADLASLTGTSLRDAPDGRAFATLSPGVTLEPVARDRGWVRVRAEGWVKESEVGPLDSNRVVLSAADLRADPEGSRGKHVRWEVQVLAMATADPLRKGLNPDEPYLLARGPGSESALLYVAIPTDLVAAAHSLASLAPVPVTLAATVRLGRSEPVGVPILEAQSLTRR